MDKNITNMVLYFVKLVGTVAVVHRYLLFLLTANGTLKYKMALFQKYGIMILFQDNIKITYLCQNF